MPARVAASTGVQLNESLVAAGAAEEPPLPPRMSVCNVTPLAP